MAFRTSRTFTVRGRPPRLAGGISEPTSAHSASVKSLSYRRPRRSAAARCSGFHMRHLSPTQVPHKESQPIPPTQLLSGTALIFLTPEGLAPDEPGYVPLSYCELAATIETLVNSKRVTSSEVLLVLRYYVEMLRRHIVPDEQL